MSLLGNRPGLSIIVTSYQRMDALYANLTSLLNQNMRDLPSEIIVVNNAHQIDLRPGLLTKLGRLFRQHPEIKLLNSRYNWRVYLRYGMAYVANYDTVFFLDDDIHCLDSDIVHDMYQTLMSLEPYDIVSCWNMLWSKWTDSEHHHVSANLFDPELTELTKTDTCGPGISMFNRRLDSGCARAKAHNCLESSRCDGYGAGASIQYVMGWHDLRHAQCISASPSARNTRNMPCMKPCQISSPIVIDFTKRCSIRAINQ